MIWTEVKPCTGGVQWEAYPSDAHAIDIWTHEREGFSWCVITDDCEHDAPEGWSATVEDAKRHAEQAYEEWLDEHDETAEVVAAAVAKERAAVFEYLAELAVNADTVEMERVLLEAAGDIHRGEHRRQEEP